MKRDLAGIAAFALAVVALAAAAVPAATADAAPSRVWSHKVGGTGTDIARSMTPLPDGSALVTGYFRNTVAFGSTSLTSAGGDDLGYPVSAPTTVTATAGNAEASVTWSAATTQGGEPVTAYTVSAAQDPTRTCAWSGGPLTCTVTGLTSESAASTASDATAPTAASGALPTTPSSTTTLYQPTPILDLQFTSSPTSKVIIPGYVCVPQGRLLVNNTTGQDIQMVGGVLAAQFDITDARATGPQTVPIGFVEAVVQRVFRIESRTSGREVSVAIVQINQNGAYAVNAWEVQ